MFLSIIIVSYNVKYFLEQCLHSVFASTFASEFEVIVVDNNSKDDSVAYLASHFPSVKFIENDENLGFAKANNAGIAQAKGKYILLLNPDTVLGEHVLEHVCSFMDEHADAGALGVKMINGNGLFLPESKRSFPTPWVSFCKISRLNKLFPNSKLFGRYHLRYLDENKVHQIDVLAGAFMLLREEALDKSGLLDETFFMYGEDIDLSYRIKLVGYKNYYLPEKIIHYKGESSHKNEYHYVRLFYGAMNLFYKKHFHKYSLLYSIFIQLGILCSEIFMFFRKYLTKIINRFIKCLIRQKVHVFNVDEISYEDIIRQMDDCSSTKTHFQIYNPSTGYSIGSNSVIKKKA